MRVHDPDPERREMVMHAIANLSIGEVRDKFGCCIGCMRPRDERHHDDCFLLLPIESASIDYRPRFAELRDPA